MNQPSEDGEAMFKFVGMLEILLRDSTTHSVSTLNIPLSLIINNTHFKPPLSLSIKRGDTSNNILCRYGIGSIQFILLV